MTVWQRAAAVDELADGEVKQVDVGSDQVALARDAGKYFALSNRCPHAGAPLSQGSIEAGLLVCPWHGREFDLATGVCASFGGVRTFEVEVRDDGIYVAFPTPLLEATSP